MVEIKNDQHAVAITMGPLKKAAQHLLGIVNYADFDLGLLFTTPAKMQEFNREFRKKDVPTDILSFMYYPDLQPGERIDAQNEDERYLGDIIMCPEKIKETLSLWPEKSVNERIIRLLVHGMCHLLGYTHDTDENAAIMEKQEDYLMHELNK